MHKPENERRFLFERVGDGYLLLKHRGFRLLLDTGAPTSFGSGLTDMPGVSAEPPTKLDNGLTIEWLVEHVGAHFDGLIGAEVLRTHSLKIDSGSETVSFSTERIDASEGLPIESAKNVPVLSGEINGNPGKIIFDTGACLNFVPFAYTKGHPEIGERAEFYPLVGEFRTKVYRLPVRLGGQSFVLNFGVFPDAIEQMHAQAGFPSIIGLELMDTHQIRLGLREKRICLDGF